MTRVDLLRFTILICTRDRASSLERTLDSLRGIDYPQPSEVVVVDNGSLDNTRDIVRRAADRSPVSVRYVLENRPGKSFALNTGITESRGDLIVFTDDDALPGKQWLTEYDDAFRKYACDWSFGRVVPSWEGVEPHWFSPELNGLFALLDFGSEPFRVTEAHHAFYGVNCAATRGALTALGAYHQDLGPRTSGGGGGEDTEMFRRALIAGQTIVYLPGATVAHCIAAERASRPFQRRRMWRARQQNYVLTSLTRPDLPHVLGIPRFQYRQAVHDLLTMTRARLTGRPGLAFSHELRVIRFGLLVEQAVSTLAHKMFRRRPAATVSQPERTGTVRS
jgi:glucosyl-dolichyl phosphate glucuronosyltransferase